MKKALKEDKEVSFTLVRDKSRFLNTLLSDLSRLEEERELARKNKNKFVGISNDSYGSQTGGSGGSMSGFGRDDYINKRYESQNSDRYDPYLPKKTEDKPTNSHIPPKTHTEESAINTQNIFNAPQITTKSQNQNLFQNSEISQAGNFRKLQAPPGSTLSQTSTINTATKISSVPEFINFSTPQTQPAPQPPKQSPSQSELDGIFFSSPSVSFPAVNVSSVPIPQTQAISSPLVPQYPPQSAVPVPTYGVPPMMPSYPSNMSSYGALPNMPQYGAPQYINPGVPSYPNPPQPGPMGQASHFSQNYNWPTVSPAQVMPGLPNYGMQPPAPQPQPQPTMLSNVKISHNMQGISEPSLSALQSSPSLFQDFTHFQEAPKSQVSSQEIEDSIVNLDQLVSNPKKDQPRWSSSFHY